MTSWKGVELEGNEKKGEACDRGGALTKSSVREECEVETGEGAGKPPGVGRHGSGRSRKAGSCKEDRATASVSGHRRKADTQREVCTHSVDGLDQAVPALARIAQVILFGLPQPLPRLRRDPRDQLGGDEAEPVVAGEPHGDTRARLVVRLELDWLACEGRPQAPLDRRRLLVDDAEREQRRGLVLVPQAALQDPAYDAARLVGGRRVADPGEGEREVRSSATAG